MANPQLELLGYQAGSWRDRFVTQQEPDSVIGPVKHTREIVTPPPPPPPVVKVKPERPAAVKSVALSKTKAPSPKALPPCDHKDAVESCNGLVCPCGASKRSGRDWTQQRYTRKGSIVHVARSRCQHDQGTTVSSRGREKCRSCGKTRNVGKPWVEGRKLKGETR